LYLELDTLSFDKIELKDHLSTPLSPTLKNLDILIETGENPGDMGIRDMTQQRTAVYNMCIKSLF
jgi:hypothetical protein